MHGYPAVHYYYVIILILNFTGILNPPDVGAGTRPVFGMGGVSVTLEWIPEDGVSYSVAVDQGMDFRYTQRSTVIMILPYNIRISVNITATSCGQISEIAITSLELAYGSYDLVLEGSVH